LPDHFRARQGRFPRGGIAGTVIHDNDAGQMTPDPGDNRRDSSGLVEAWYHCGALSFPIRHVLAMRAVNRVN
jgi:hypothetical protein